MKRGRKGKEAPPVSIRHLMLLSLLAFCVAPPVHAGTITVDLGGAGDYAEIQAAIDAAGDGDEVLVNPGEYLITEPISFLGKGITLRAQAGPGETTIRMSQEPDDPNSASVVIFENFEDDSAVLDGFLLTGGREGIMTAGEGVHCYESSPTLANCTISGNSGSGVLCLQDSNPTLTGCAISGNSADSGGGVYCRDSSPALVNCAISGNSAISGGGLYCAGNSAPTLADCTVSGNSGTEMCQPGFGCWGGQGAGLYCGSGSSPTLTHCTISGNLSGGFFCQSGSSLTVANCIVWDNAGRPIQVEGDSDQEITYSCVEGEAVWPGEGNINSDPLFCGWGEATEVYVDAANPGPGDGTQENPFSSLDRALEYSLALSPESPCRAAGEGGVDMGARTGACDEAGERTRLVHLAGGTYSIAGLNLSHKVSMDGAGEGETVIQGTVRGLRTGATLSHLTVTGGTEGGIVVRGGQDPEVRNCTISGNSAFHGGGVYCRDSSPTLTDCTITGNSVRMTCTMWLGCRGGAGGGLYCYESSPTLANCTISGNQAEDYGGGVYCDGDSSPSLTSCTISGNRTVDSGGGVYCGESSPTLTDCTISENVATGSGDPLSGLGGGVYCNWDSSPRLTGCTISGNSAFWSGGGMQCSGASLILANCTVSGNSAAWGGGLYCDWGSSATVTNCILWDNTEESIWDDSDPGAQVTYSCIDGDPVWPGEGNINEDPLFCGWAEAGEVYVDGANPGPGDGTQGDPFATLDQALGYSSYSLALSSESPCLGAGEGGVDMGAALGVCDVVRDTRLVHLARGTYGIGRLNLVRGISIEGAGERETVIEGTVWGLQTGAILSHLTITGGTQDGIVVDAGQAPEIRSCTVTGNPGYGVFCSDSSPAIVNCTVSGNSGAGIYCTHSSPALASCIVWDNAEGSISVRGDSRPAVTYSCIEIDPVWPGEGNINDDPLFCGWTDGGEVHVDNASPGPGNGTEENPFSNLEQALNSSSYSLALSPESPCRGAGEGGVDMGSAAGPCDVPGEKTRLVHLAPGTYGVPKMNLSHKISIEGAEEGETVIRGTVRGLRTGARLSHLRVSGGTQGGILVGPGQSPEIADCTISGNSGHGISCSNSSPTLANCVITGNRVGGVRCANQSSPTLASCTVEGNSGSGVSCSNSSPMLSSCMISRNSAHQGGGLYCEEDSSPVLTDCTISRNDADEGGGVYSQQSSPILTNCTISGNDAPKGGGVYCWQSSPALANCTIWGNSVRIRDPEGSGLYSADSSPTLTNCIVWDNPGGSVWIEVISFPKITYSCLEGDDAWPGEGNINDDPLFCGWGDAGEVFVDAANLGPGDGTREDPFSSLDRAFEYSLALFLESPCRGAGEGGVDMGAPTGACDAAGERTRLVHLPQGTYSMADCHLFHRASMEGAGEGETVIEGTVWGLRTGATLSHLTVTGGEVVVRYGEAPEISNCTLSGGVSCSGTSSPRFTDCTLSGVSCFDDSSPAIADCKISGVSCSDNSFPTLTNCRISGNSDSGVSCDGNSSPILTNCMISGNQADIVGGGLECSGDSSPTLINCTITGNVVRRMCVLFLCIGGEGGGVYCGENASPTLTNCIVWDNVTESIWVGENATPQVAYSCIQEEWVWPGQRNTNLDPLFVHPGQWIDTRGTPQDRTDDNWVEGGYHLRATSPAIDAGTSEGAPATDMEGRERACGEGIDMGAYESCGVLFRRGDADADGKIHLMDVMVTLTYIFGRGAEITCQKSADCDDSGKMALADALLILNYIFAPGSSPPAEPFSECGTDLTVDNLTCESFAPCE